METYDPILESERFERPDRFSALRRARGQALVLVGHLGALAVLRRADRLTVGKSHLGRISQVYTVDLRRHQLLRMVELPGRGPDGRIVAMFWLTCWVTDPVQIVADNIRDAGAVLWPIVERHAWAAAREFTLLDSAAAHRAITEWFASIRLHPAFGTEIKTRVLVIQDEQGHRRELPDRIPVEERRYMLSPWWDDLWERGDGDLLFDRLEARSSDMRSSDTREYVRLRPPGEERREGRYREFVTLHVYARMDPDLIVDQVTTVQVIVSQKRVRHDHRRTEVTGQADADPRRPILVEAIGRANLVVVGPDRHELPVPARGEPRLVLFDVQATHPGEGELWVVVRQGPLPLLTLVLRPLLRDQPGPPGPSRSAVAAGEALVGPPAEPPLTVLRINEERHGDAVVYRYDLDAPEFGFTRAYASRLIDQDRDAYVRGLFHRIEAVWVDSGEDVVAFQEQLRAFGAELLDELVPVELQRDLWAHRDQLAHIVVLSTEPFIPWELVHLKHPDAGRLPTETRFLAQLGLVRWLWHPQQPGRHANLRLPTRLRVRVGHVRYVIPDYPDPKLQLAAPLAEQAFLEQHLGATPVVPHHGEVLALLREPGGFDLLHFAGHGQATGDSIADAELLLEGRLGRGGYKPEPLRVAVVRQNFRAADDRPSPVVVLNACQTGRLGHQLASIGGFAEAFVGGGAGAFVSSLWSVGDSPARAFVEALYEMLLAGKPMAAAVRAAREEARAAGDATWLAYTVYAHPGARLVLADRPDNVDTSARG
jgi:hypothetical protein